MSSRYWTVDGFDGVELLRSSASSHRYARHSHEGYALGVVEAGAHVFTARGQKWTAITGRIILVNPDDAHDGGPAAHAEAYSYRMIYIDAAVFEAALGEAAGRRGATTFFSESVVGDAALAGWLLQVHRALEHPEARLEREALLVTALVALARRHGTAAPPVDQQRLGPREVALALEYLSANFAEDCSLAQLAALAGVGRVRLLRAFHRRLGLPPHLYQTQLRLRQAKRLMLAGEPPAMAAVAVGFADQSHLIRKFKAAYGITPGDYLGRRTRSRTLQ